MGRERKGEEEEEKEKGKKERKKEREREVERRKGKNLFPGWLGFIKLDFSSFFFFRN